MLASPKSKGLGLYVFSTNERLPAVNDDVCNFQIKSLGKDFAQIQSAVGIIMKLTHYLLHPFDCKGRRSERSFIGCKLDNVCDTKLPFKFRNWFAGFVGFQCLDVGGTRRIFLKYQISMSQIPNKFQLPIFKPSQAFIWVLGIRDYLKFVICLLEFDTEIPMAWVKGNCLSFAYLEIPQNEKNKIATKARRH